MEKYSVFHLAGLTSLCSVIGFGIEWSVQVVLDRDGKVTDSDPSMENSAFGVADA